MKILIQYKNGEQIVGDTAALISPHSSDLIEDSVELDDEEYSELVLTQSIEEDTIEKMKGDKIGR